uniref:Reverse transcriptase domain-containing protein n=1 Tax=Tanacetum cinerariifolium TaxID=118510 RepID=A0A699IIL4_TANCI|nr:hypothetical protein [Tanacetum cinerariifolium]GEU93418.1 hypothetical protein [Tanacetum cinerariifolium]GEZ40659.1 hypothetical protein [Tanacetum cinerariifolium]
MQSSAGRFFRRNVSSSGKNRSSNNYGKGRKKQNGANGVRDNKMSFAIQRHNRNDRNETPRSGRFYHPFYDQIPHQLRNRNDGNQERGSMRMQTLGKGARRSSGKHRGTWTGSERIAVSRFVMEHQLKIYPFTEPVVHKRRPMTPDERLVLKEKVFWWLKEGMLRKVQHLVWVANTIPVKLANGTWKVQVDYSSLNKVCATPFRRKGKS